eukprot:scaffold137093_cov33-Tisochrysis_lutea.AAC.1
MATSHSTREEVWMTHVGTDNAFAGSSGHRDGGRLPIPPSQGVCTAVAPRMGTTSAESAERPPRMIAAVRSRGVLSSAADSPSRKPKTTMQLVMASSDSAAPCNQSASASETPNRAPALMAAGIEPKTKARRKVRPKVTPCGARTVGCPIQ